MRTRRQFIAGSIAAAGLAACARTARRIGQAGTGPAEQRGPAGTAPGPSGPSGARTAPGGPARFVAFGDRAVARAALTFHGSGDPALTYRMLDLAARARVPMTVFAVGRWLQAHPEVAGRILAGGHELANHTYTHPALLRVDRPDVAAEIRRCRDVLAGATGSGGRWFRPSGVQSTPTAMILEEAGAAGYPTVVGFDVDPRDYADPGADVVVRRTVPSIGPGSIVSLHLGHPGTVSAFEPIVDAAHRRGLALVTVGDLLGG